MKKLNESSFIWLVEHPINRYNDNIEFFKSLKFLFDYSYLNNDLKINNYAKNILSTYVKCGFFDIKNNIGGTLYVSKFLSEEQKQVVIILSKRLEKKFNINLKQKNLDENLSKY